MLDDAVDPNEPDGWADVEATDGEEAMGRDSFSCKLSSGIAEAAKTRLTYAEVAQLAKSAGVPCGYNLVKAVAIAAAESSRYPCLSAQHNCSTDRGIWQINSRYWGSYSSFDLKTNAEGMFVVSEQGTALDALGHLHQGDLEDLPNSACSAAQDLCGKWYC